VGKPPLRWLLLGAVLLVGAAAFVLWPSPPHDTAFRDQRAGERQHLESLGSVTAKVTAEIQAARQAIPKLEARIAELERERLKVREAGAALVERASQDGGAQAVVDSYRAAGYQAVVVRVKK
jgi:TolA-binding protein